MGESFEKSEEINTNPENNIETEKEWKPNLLTDYKRTMEFMKVIEGPGWLEDQPHDVKARGTLEYVMKWLKTAEDSEFVTTLYGWGGGDRYKVRRDGSVVFLSHFSIKKTLDRAKNLGFPIENY